MKNSATRAWILVLIAVVCWCEARGQNGRGEGRVRAVTIPVTVKTKTEMAMLPPLVVREDGELQQTLSVRGAAQSPLQLAVLVQDDVVSSIGNDIQTLADFIRRLPSGSRVMVGYLTAGTLQVRQRFTTDLERAARALRVPIGAATAAPFNPYVQVIEALRRFDGLPTGRRAIIMISDGLDLSRGLDAAAPTQSIDLERAIREAQRRAVAVYTIYAPTFGGTGLGGLRLVSYGQGSLNRLAEETGGQSFFQGTGAPVSIAPFLREIGASLQRQLAVTYLSTHPDRGFHRIEIRAEGLELRYPPGYTR